MGTLVLTLCGALLTAVIVSPLRGRALARLHAGSVRGGDGASDAERDLRSAEDAQRWNRWGGGF